MHRFLSLIITIALLVGLLACPVAAEEQPDFSLDALDQFCGIWDDYYDRYQMNLHGGYTSSEDGVSLSGLCITYNGDRQEVAYDTDIIPSTSYLFFIYQPDKGYYGFCVFSDNMKSDLEKVVIYADDQVLNVANVGSSHEDGSDMWSISLNMDEMLDLYSKDEFTLRLSVDGKSEIIDISRDKQKYIYDMLEFLIKGQLYADKNYSKYLSAEFLPGGIRSTPTPEPTEEQYSISKDYERIDQIAKSVFYVETYSNVKDRNGEDTCLGSGSGFVTFDEHLFVTNQHVIKDADYLKIWDDDNNMYIIDKVAISDKAKDIAILQFPDGKKYEKLEPDDNEELKRGQPVITIGSPQGFQNTVAYGNISAFPTLDDGMNYIQFTAPISHGSSGGCLFDDVGKLIGVTSMGNEEGENIGLAIPIKRVLELYEQWDKNDYEQLGTKRSWNSVAITSTPSPSPTPTPTPTPTPSPTPEPTIEVTINQQMRTGVYIGDLTDGLPHGHGIFDSKDDLPELHYEGNWDKGSASGKGTMIDKGYTIHFDDEQGIYERTGPYEGDVIDGIPNGKGKFSTINAEGVTWTYTGEFSDGTFNGYGEQTWEGGGTHTGLFVNGNFTPSLSQLINSLAIGEGYSLYDNSMSFLENNESIFMSQTDIDRGLITDKEWLVSAFKSNPQAYSDQFIHLIGLNVVQLYEMEGYGRDCVFAILEDSAGTIFYGYFTSSVDLHEGSAIGDLFVLPLNWITYKNSNDEDREAVLCAFAALGCQEIIPTPSPSPEPTPTMAPTSTPEPTPEPSPTPQTMNYGDNSSYKIVLPQSEITIYRGNPIAIVPSVVSLVDDKPAKGVKVFWESSDSSVAEVNKNQIASKSTGDVTLRCNLLDDESVYSLLFVHVLEPVTGISFAEQSIEMACNTDNNQYTLHPIIEPISASYEGIEYTSSNEKIASVDTAGVITAKSPGKAKITAIVSMNGVKKLPKSVVDVSVANRITAIEDESSYIVEVKKTLRLAPIIVPEDATNKKLKWETTNKDIADVDANGVVKGIKAGVCTITASSQDGGNAKLTYSIVVRQPVTAVKLNSSINPKISYSHSVETDLSLTRIFEVEPYNASVKELEYKVFKDNEETTRGFKIENNSIKFTAEGLYTVQAISKDGTNKSAKLKLRVYPADLLTLSMNYAKWQPVGNDQLSISFELINAEYGLWIEAVELYVYATDSWGNKIYGKDKVYYGTTNKDIGPGKKIYSDRIVIPNRSQISKFYCGIHKVKYYGDEFGVKTYEPHYFQWSYK